MSEKINFNMNDKERFFIRNYPFFGAACGRRCSYSKKEARKIKKKYREQGIYMLPIRKSVEDRMPTIAGKDDDSFSTIGFAVAHLNYEDQNAIIELSKNIPDPSVLIDETIALQLSRISRGYRAELEQGRLLDSTETAIQNYVSMIQAKKNIEDGQELNVNVKSTISSLIDELDREEENEIDSDIIDFDYDKESKKQKLKDLRKEEIDNLINEEAKK